MTLNEAGKAYRSALTAETEARIKCEAASKAVRQAEDQFFAAREAAVTAQNNVIRIAGAQA